MHSAHYISSIGLRDAMVVVCSIMYSVVHVWMHTKSGTYIHETPNVLIILTTTTQPFRDYSELKNLNQ